MRAGKVACGSQSLLSTQRPSFPTVCYPRIQWRHSSANKTNQEARCLKKPTSSEFIESATPFQDKSDDCIGQSQSTNDQANEQAAFSNALLTVGAVTVLSLLSLTVDQSIALAAETEQAATRPLLPGIGVVQGTILLVPVVLYTVFTIYKTGFNRDAKASDFLLLIVSIFIFGNILSTLILKTRLF